MPYICYLFIVCMSSKTETTGAVVKKIQQIQTIYDQNVPYDPIKEMDSHTLGYVLLLESLSAGWHKGNYCKIVST